VSGVKERNKSFEPRSTLIICVNDLSYILHRVIKLIISGVLQHKLCSMLLLEFNVIKKSIKVDNIISSFFKVYVDLFKN